jgi:LPXTG-motif cell wall-anchored protein
MLELVGHPVAVNPDKELARIAREREWEIRNFVRPVRLRDRMPAPSTGTTIAASTALAAIGAGVAAYLLWKRRAAATS